VPRDQDNCTGKLAGIDVTLEGSSHSLKPSDIETKFLGMRSLLQLLGSGRNARKQDKSK